MSKSRGGDNSANRTKNTRTPSGTKYLTRAEREAQMNRLMVSVTVVIGIIICLIVAGAFIADTLIHPNEMSSAPTLSPAQVQKQYVLMTPADAEKKAQDLIAALPATTRQFLQDFSGDLVSGMVQGVRINDVEDVLIAVVSQQMTITSATGNYDGTIYCLLFNTTDIEVMSAGTKHIIKKGLWSWGVGPEKVSLQAMTDPGHEEIVFDQPFPPFTDLTARFLPVMSVADQSFAITIAGKQIDFRALTAQATANPTIDDSTSKATPNSSGSSSTSGTRPPFDTTYPFAVGTSWTYTKTVTVEQDILFWVKLNMTDGGTAEMLINDANCAAGTYTVKYLVVKQLDDHSWEIEVSSSSDKCLGRYRDADQIVWSLEAESMPPNHFGNRIVEQIRYGEWPEDWPINQIGSQLAEPITHSQPLIYVMSGPGDSLFENKYAVAYTFYQASSSTMDTPVGTFDGCTTMVSIYSREIAGQETPPALSELQNGATEKSSYCRGIGFAEFTRSDLKGTPIYKMQLVEYHLAGQN